MLAKSNKIGGTIINALKISMAVVFAVVSTNLFLSILVAFMIPFFLWKSLVTLLAKFVFPGARILALQDSAMAKGQVYLQKDLYITGHINFQGRLNFNDFVDTWEKRVMQRVRPNGDIMFPELKCYIETWLGYSFYRVDENFDLKNYIQLYEDPVPNSVVDRKKLDKIKREFTDRVFQTGRSPWEILVVNNCIIDDEGQEHSVVMTKIHHCLGDGYCATLLFWESLYLQEIPSLKKPKSASMKRSIFQRIAIIVNAAYNFFVLIGKGPFYLVYKPSWVFDENAWHRRDQLSDTIYCTLRPIETTVCKEIAQIYGVTVTTVLLAVAAAGFRRMMTAKGLDAPKNMRTIYSLPFPNHPNRLTTWASATYFNINITNSDDKKRLENTERNMNKAVRAMLLFGTQFGMFLSSCFPISIKHKIKPGRAVGASMFSATIPMPSPPPNTDIELLGCRLVGQYSTCEVVTANFSYKTNTLKYKNHFFMNFGIQTHLLRNEDEIYDIEKFVWDEINYLLEGKNRKNKDEIAINICEITRL